MSISGTKQEWDRACDNVNNRRNGWNGDAHADSEQQPFATSNWSRTLPPPRQWLYGDHYIRGSLSCTIADGGTCKTSLALIEAIAMALGRPPLGIAPLRRCHVLYLNGEEPLDEIRRRVHAICQHYSIDPVELNGWRFLRVATPDQRFRVACWRLRSATLYRR